MQVVKSEDVAGPSPTVGEHQGTGYDLVLAAMHRHLKPRTYFEIGTLTGITLTLASCPSIAVDPQFRIAGNVLGHKPQCLFFQQESDAFFANHSPSNLFGRPIDFAFLDGMHYFEYLLRDFMNTERHCARNSVVMLHDCIPCNLHLARRDADDMSLQRMAQYPTQWAGDVWKTVLALRKYRPDLRIHAFDAPPTGLVAITNLDPNATALGDNYFAIVAEFAGLDLAQYGVDRLHRELGVTSTAPLMEHISLSKLFWL